MNMYNSCLNPNPQILPLTQTIFIWTNIWISVYLQVYKERKYLNNPHNEFGVKKRDK
jgi:hypothetical protein